MRKNNENLSETKFDSAIWRYIDEDGACCYFTDIGFRKVGEILDLRFYDFLNMNHIDNNRAEAMMVCLYYLMNGSPAVDEGIYFSEIDQDFDFTGWRKKHPEPSNVRVRDIVLAEGINQRAMYRIFDRLTQRFYRSDEYNGRIYRYSSYRDYKKQKKAELAERERK